MHNRQSIRLPNYDYSENGAYFVTICTQDRAVLFGEIEDGEMRCNEAGDMVAKWWQELENKFPHIALDTWIVMPDHFHGIIVIQATVGAVCPIRDADSGKHIGLPLRGSEIEILGDHVGSPLWESVTMPSLSMIIQWFKTMTTNEYIRGVKTDIYPPFNKRFWQRNFYEHIIRDGVAFQKIQEYIINNPKNWEHGEHDVSGP